MVGKQPARVAEGSRLGGKRGAAVSAPDGSPVTVKQIAKEIGVSGSQVSRYLLKYGIAPVGKMPSARGKRASVYPADTVARLRALGVG